MSDASFHVLTVGWGIDLVEKLWYPVAENLDCRFSHIVHPRNFPENSPPKFSHSQVHFFAGENGQLELPESDNRLLAALERAGVPSLHNMILGDRVVSKLEYADALRYATFIARRLISLFGTLRPTVVIGGFDAVHGSLALAVSRYLDIPWFAMNFSVIPPGMACFCDHMSPASRVSICEPDVSSLRLQADSALRDFESKSIQVHAHIAAPPLSISRKMAQLPVKIAATIRTIRKSRHNDILRYTDERRSFSVGEVLKHYRRTSRARSAIRHSNSIAEPPAMPFILFGLHMQPESSIDVWAPFYSNQIWVIEFIARSIPPTHKLLVKIHKSDVANYSSSQLQKMCSFPGVELVEPFSDSRDFLQRAELIVAIQGTMGLEAALLGKPVIMLADSPVTLFPSVSRISELSGLPSMVKEKLTETPPSRRQILDAYAEFLAPFFPASHNDWTTEISATQISRYTNMITTLNDFLAEKTGPSKQAISSMADSG